MRVRDEFKREALFEATVKVVNRTGFASSSVARIAAEAGISPATIYIYYKNKEDLLVSTYVEIKKELSRALLRDFDDTRPIRDILQRIWLNGFSYVSEHRDYFNFADQFANSPFADLVDKAKIETFYEPMMQVLKRGIEQKIIKDIDLDLLLAFVFHPLMTLSNKRSCSKFDPKSGNIEKAFELAWDAIRL